MKKLLVINACVHRKTSRTQKLCRAWIDHLCAQEPYEIEEVILEEEGLHALDTGSLARRNRLMQEGKTEHVMFHQARQLRKADEIIIAAPYWDLSFPASLKCYMEAVSVVGLTFQYVADSRTEGLCRAKRLTYITTAGGYIGENNFGYAYVKAMAQLFGIAETDMIRAEGLDIQGADVEQIMRQAVDKIEVK